MTDDEIEEMVRRLIEDNLDEETRKAVLQMVRHAFLCAQAGCGKKLLHWPRVDGPMCRG
jgi:hypothetical protein